MGNTVGIEKVDILSFIQNLVYLHNSGYDFVDISITDKGKIKPHEINLTVRNEYMCSEDEREHISIDNPLYKSKPDDIDEDNYFNEIS